MWIWDRDFFSHDMRAQYLHAGFFIHIEYLDPALPPLRIPGKHQRRRWRYVQIEVYATGLEGMEGATTSLDENWELVRAEMDEQSVDGRVQGFRHDLEYEKEEMVCTPF